MLKEYKYCPYCGERIKEEIKENMIDEKVKEDNEILINCDTRAMKIPNKVKDNITSSQMKEISELRDKLIHAVKQLYKE